MGVRHCCGIIKEINYYNLFPFYKPCIHSKKITDLINARFFANYLFSWFSPTIFFCWTYLIMMPNKWNKKFVKFCDICLCMFYFVGWELNNRECIEIVSRQHQKWILVFFLLHGKWIIIDKIIAKSRQNTISIFL